MSLLRGLISSESPFRFKLKPKPNAWRRTARNETQESKRGRGGNRIQKTPANETMAKSKMAHKGATNKINCIFGITRTGREALMWIHKNMHMMADFGTKCGRFSARIARESADRAK